LRSLFCESRRGRKGKPSCPFPLSFPSDSGGSPSPPKRKKTPFLFFSLPVSPFERKYSGPPRWGGEISHAPFFPPPSLLAFFDGFVDKTFFLKYLVSHMFGCLRKKGRFSFRVGPLVVFTMEERLFFVPEILEESTFFFGNLAESFFPFPRWRR